MDVKTGNYIFKAAAITGAVVAPTYYITQKHMDMYPKTQPIKRERMRNKILGFLGGLVPGLVVIHAVAIRKMDNTKKIALGVVGGALAFVGSQLGLTVAKKYSPKE